MKHNIYSINSNIKNQLGLITIFKRIATEMRSHNGKNKTINSNKELNYKLKSFILKQCVLPNFSRKAKNGSLIIIIFFT